MADESTATVTATSDELLSVDVFRHADRINITAVVIGTKKWLPTKTTSVDCLAIGQSGSSHGASTDSKHCLTLCTIPLKKISGTFPGEIPDNFPEHLVSTEH